MRFLIVDDTARARQSMRALLEVWYPKEEVREAANGTEAVQLAEEFQPDLILMDARMPGMSGLEAIHQIKANLPEVRIIILSVHAGREQQEKARAAGAEVFVTKSASYEVLANAILGRKGNRP